MSSSAEKPTLRQQLEYAGITTLGWAIRKLPYRALRVIANFMGGVVFLFDARGREVALANLDAAFGESMTPERKREVARGGYQTFARTMLELFWAPNLSREICHKVATFEGLDLAPCHKDASLAAIYVCLHYSNFEWLSLLGAYAISNGTVVAQRFKNPLIGPIFDRMRSSTGNPVIPQERAMIRMLKHLKDGGKFAMLTDLNLDPTEASVIVDTFGGLKICATQMHAALAQRTGARIVPVECRPLPDGRYRMIYHKPLEYPPEATAAEIAQMCWDVLEPALHEQPECWIWSYKHWRFKPSDDRTGRYPFYANAAKRFDKLLKKGA